MHFTAFQRIIDNEERLALNTCVFNANLTSTKTWAVDVHAFIIICWLVGFVALRPKSTAMVIAGRSVHLTTLFPGQA